MLKFADNPPLLHPPVDSLTLFRGTWWVGHTKSRCEKAFAWDLHSRGVAYFIPMAERMIFSGGTRRRVMAPLFSSYVFFCGDDQARYQALRTDRLCQVIPVADQKSFQRELLSIERALLGEAVLDPYPHAVVGKRCRAVRGPFMGVEGIVTERDSITRLVLQVSLLGQAVALQIDADVLESVDG